MPIFASEPKTKIVKLIDRIRTRFIGKSAFLRPAFTFTGWEGMSALPFGELVFRNIVELLTDICNDVTFTLAGDRGRMTFAEFVRFFSEWGESALWRVYRYGFAVVAYRWNDEADPNRFVTEMRLLDPDEWREVSAGGNTYIRANDDNWRVFVMMSQTYKASGVSDYHLCRPAIEFLDNTLNASNTSVKKLGAIVVASPETAGAAPTPAVLNKKDKEDMEAEIGKEYGLLSKQRQIMLLPRSMRFETVSLTSIDNRLVERVRLNTELIADRLRVPASQVAVIDATAGKSLSNGGEVHEGDRLKYKTFERMLNKTFIALAAELGLRVSYMIYNKPADSVTGAISEQG